MKKETESGEDEIKPKLRRKPTELDSDDDEDTVDDVKPLTQVSIEMTDPFKINGRQHWLMIECDYRFTGGKSWCSTSTCCSRGNC